MATPGCTSYNDFVFVAPICHSAMSQSALFRSTFLCFLRNYLKYPIRCKTAPTTKGSATVASSNTSANFPPSSGGTNFPHDTASVYVLPLNPPQCTGSGQILTP